MIIYNSDKLSKNWKDLIKRTNINPEYEWDKMKETIINIENLINRE